MKEKRRPRLIYRDLDGKVCRADNARKPATVEVRRGKRVLMPERALNKAESAFVIGGNIATMSESGLTQIAWNPNQVADAAVNVLDMQWVIAHWGQQDGHGQVVGVQHLLAVIKSWGPVTPPTTAITPSGPITLGNGPHSIGNLKITGLNGIKIENDKRVTTLDLSNLEIRVTNYGLYCGLAERVNARGVRIFCDPTGGDSYSVRGTILHFDSADSEYHSGIKAFRIYGLRGGQSVRDTFTGDRLMLGGGSANEWGTAQAFENFTFRDGSIDVNSCELYAATRNVRFERMDWSGTGHISIQFTARDIAFVNCIALPQIKFFNASGNRYTPTAQELAQRGIIIA